MERCVKKVVQKRKKNLTGPTLLAVPGYPGALLIARNSQSGEFLRHTSTLLDFSRVVALLRYWSLQGRVACKRELDGADGFTFEEFGVRSDTEGF
jgi:hypothetical protein